MQEVRGMSDLLCHAARRLQLILGLFTLAIVFCSPAAAQLTADQQADMLLDAAKRAYNEKNYPLAAQKFQEFIGKYGNHKDIASARYGLVLAILDGPDKDYQKAWENLQPLFGAKEFTDYPMVLYYAGLSQRGLGLKTLAVAATKPPQEAAEIRKTANQQFEEGAKQFAGAVAAFAARYKELPGEDVKELPVDVEWTVRARCDQAEMLLRVMKTKEAQAAVVPVVDTKVLAKSRYYKQALYYHGFACFLQKEHLAAGRSLNHLAPFDDPVFGTHARYLIARIHHLDGERAEAAEHYEGVLAEYAKQKLAAAQALNQPEKFKNDPEEKARLEALAKGPVPDHVARATFYVAVLHAENGKFNEARDRFTAFIQQNPQSPLVPDAQLRMGYCMVQLKQSAEAIAVLQPLAEKNPKLADQALLWIAKAQVAAADPANPQAYDQGLKTAIDTFRRAAERAQQNQDADAKQRRGEILIEMAETQQLLKQYKDAAGTYNIVLNEKLIPARDEEVLQGLVSAQHLSGDFGESDKTVDRFVKAYPKSTLMPAVLFRSAENAYFTLQAVEKNNNLNPQDKAKEIARWQDETAKRYQVVIDKYPEFSQIQLARFAIGMITYNKGDLEKAKETLSQIPQAERVGELAVVPYIVADCAMRLAPQKVDDALAAGRLEELLKEAVDNLENFANSQPNSAQAPDALLKLGMCQQRQASLVAVPAERTKVLQNARGTYDKLLQQFGNHAAAPQAIIERARCIVQMGDINGGMNELRRFTQDPLKNNPAAPMGVLQLAGYLRSQNKAQEAADMISQCRQQQEQNLLKDPARSAWVPLLQYHQGVALQEAGKLPDARQVFEGVIKQYQNAPEALEAIVHTGQCLRDESAHKLEDAKKRLATPNLKPEDQAAAQKDHDAAVKGLQDAVGYLEGEAEKLKAKQPPVEARARMLYEAAWAGRRVAEVEVAAARSKIQQEQWQKLRDEAAKKTPKDKPVPNIPMPEISIMAVPVQPSEQKVQGLYKAILEGFPDLPLGVDVRFELAELHGDRAEYDAAIKLIKDALDKEPSGDLAERIRLRYGVCLAAKGDAKAGLAQFQAVIANPKSPWLAQANYRAGECCLQMDDAQGAVKYLALFRDQQPFQNVPGVTDRALLRLGHAFANLQKWEESRQAHERAAGIANSPWLNDARYGMGWALQNLKRLDDAVNVYSQVTASTAAEVGARAQLQIGLCRLEQKRYPDATSALLMVPLTYDYPELSAAALCEAGRAFAESKDKDQAIKLLERVQREYPQSKWADVAKERLEKLKGG
jgi:TolA-binding protein